MQKLDHDRSPVFEMNPHPMWVIDRASMRFLAVNQATVRYYGYSREEFLAMTLRDVRPAATVPALQDRWERLDYRAAAEAPIPVGTWTHRRKDGSLITVEVTASAIIFEGREALLALMTDITGRLRAEESARVSRERFELVSRAVNDTIWDWDILTGRVWRSENTHVFGTRREELEPSFEAWRERIHPDDRDRLLASIQSTFARRERAWSGEYRLRRGDGTWSDALDRALVIYDATGRPVRMIGSVVDMTDRKRIDQALLDQGRRLRAIFDNAQDAVFLTGDDGRFLDANPAACALFGYGLDELRSSSIWDLILQELQDEYRERLRTRMRTGRQSGEGRGRRKDGMVVDVEYRTVANIEPGVHLAVIRDITERNRANRSLMEQKRRLQSLFDNTQDAILLFHDDGRYLDANPAACELFGYSREEIPSLTLWDVTLPEERRRVRERLRRLIRAGRLSGEGRRLCKDGTVVEIEFRNVANIEPGVHLAVMRDITQRKRDEESLRRLSGELLRLQDDERRRIARELHDSTAQSLAAMSLELGILGKESKALGERARKSLDEMNALVDHCSKELRTLSYLLHPPLLDEMGLAAALRGYLDGFSQRSGIRVDLEMPDDLGRLPRDLETTLFRVVQECLTNVHRHASSPVARVRLAREPGTLVLEVVDRGRGLPPHGPDRDERDRPGLGVGIAGMKERTRLLGGRLELESTPSGLTVRALLPLELP